MNSIERVVAELRTVADPYERLYRADRLDGALAGARSLVAEIKRDAVNSLRTPARGYGGIAYRLGLTKARVQQIANMPDRFVAVSYAFRDEQGTWHGEPELLPTGSYTDRRMAQPFKPADRFNPLWGQTLAMRCGDLADDERVGLNALFVTTQEGGQRPVRATHVVLDELFGPSEVGTARRDQWEAARERRRRELESG